MQHDAQRTDLHTVLAIPVARAARLIVASALVLIIGACGVSAESLVGDASFQAEPDPTVQVDESDTAAAVEDTSSTNQVLGATPGPEPTAVEITTDDQDRKGQPETDDADDAPTAAEPTPEPAGPAFLTVASGGAVGQRNQVEFIVGQSATTTLPLANIGSGEPSDEVDGPWLVVDVWAESLARADWTAQNRGFEFVLETADGRIVADEQILDHVGERSRLSNIDTNRGHFDLRVVFPIAAAEDVQGARLQVVTDDPTLPLILPLDGPGLVTPYPLTLASGERAQFNSGASTGCDDGALIESVVERASLRLEGGNDADERVAAGERFLAVDLAATNLTEDLDASIGTLYCANVGLWAPFVLEVDGRQLSPLDDPSGDIAFGATGTLALVWRIPADAGDVALLAGASQDPIAAWSLDVPAVPGEPGAVEARAATTGEPPAAATVPVTGELQTLDVGAPGATGSMYFVDATVGGVTATTSDPAALVAGSPTLDPEGRAWAIVDVSFQSGGEAEFFGSERNLVLEDPFGRPHAAVEMFDPAGRGVGQYSFRGADALDLRVVFETSGLMTDATGWVLSFEEAAEVPVRLPLDGSPADDRFPFALTAGQSEIVRLVGHNLCDAGEKRAEVLEAQIALEGSGRFGTERWRVEPGHRLVVIDLGLTNQTPGAADRLNSVGCSSVNLWPEYLLRADGRPIQALRTPIARVEQGATEDFEFVYEIPADTQTIELWGGSDPTLIAGWVLKDDGEVLQDFDAESVDERTLITLDEQVLFAFGESTLQRDAIAPLNRVASVLQSASTGDIDILGHTDSIGDDASNQALSEARAQAVADFLIEAGVDADRLVITGAGESAPVAPNENPDGTDNPDGRAQNRRVEILFSES